jgi:DNA-binding NtrC family response regulator
LRLRLIGDSASFHGAVRRIAKLARSDAPVLITGETGSGKELAARAIHYLGLRRDKPFIPINCGAIPDGLIEAELFGHARGAFTDAKAARPGVVAQAHGGTLFLDEVDALTSKAQVTLLRFLQDLRYRPLGQSVEVSCDIRVIGATNRPLPPLVAAGQFRGDLLYRLDILSLALPALREREDDAVLLARHFQVEFSALYGLSPKSLHPETVAWIRSYAWPGNIRELENLIHRQTLLSEGDEILYRGEAGGEAEGRGHEAAACPDFRSAKASAIAAFERSYLVRVLAEAHGNVTLASCIAHKERRAFGKLLKKHGIDKGRFRA